MKQEAEKKMVILKLPKILIFHLKRFSYDGLWRQKLQTMVDFPIQNLDMNPYVFTPRSQNTYHLYGVVVNISHCKNSVYHKWYKFDDQEVSELNLTEVRNEKGNFHYFKEKQRLFLSLGMKYEKMNCEE
ncbi:USP8 [Cordylochernes scorpioides]|uniref:ubiquitinyl hydrolase 1 n=1 Tax=Cordylochernes scorpioides TaxID=51811 RepID=A0ABY6KMP6_9ARAC|nr:USP8 [Cordylochernes scorpioides]